MNRIRKRIVLAIALALAVVWMAGGESPEADSTATTPAARPSAAAAAGYVVHIDPVEGRLASRPHDAPAEMWDEEMRNRLSTSSQGLVEVPSPIPGGGTMVELQGRFQHAFVASVDDSGHAGASCVATAPESPGQGGDSR